jgi:hypothetical protein
MAAVTQEAAHSEKTEEYIMFFAPNCVSQRRDDPVRSSEQSWVNIGRYNRRRRWMNLFFSVRDVL